MALVPPGVTQSLTSNRAGWVISIDANLVNSVVGPQIEQAVRRAAFKTKERVLLGMASRTDTGRMRGKVVAVSSEGGNRLSREWRVEARASHTMYQEAGTRAHGPVTARVLVFRPKGAGRTVYARWVRGVTPARFMENAAKQISVTDFL